MSISNRFLILKNEIPPKVKLIAVTKSQEPEQILKVYQNGHKIFGENKVQEIVRKKDLLPEDIEWHMIGHLQTNKVKYIAPFIAMIQSIDSLKLLSQVNRQGEKHQRIIDCLLQFYIAFEETKFGLDIDEATSIIEDPTFHTFNNVRICGVMGMASFTNNKVTVKKEFNNLSEIFHFLKNKYFADHDHFCEISMGMTNDYEVAIEEGSTMLRIGSKIFTNS